MRVVQWGRPILILLPKQLQRSWSHPTGTNIRYTWQHMKKHLKSDLSTSGWSGLNLACCVLSLTCWQFPVIITRSNNIYGPRQYTEKVRATFVHLFSMDYLLVAVDLGLKSKLFLNFVRLFHGFSHCCRWTRNGLCVPVYTGIYILLLWYYNTECPVSLCSFEDKKKKRVLFFHSTIQGTLPISRHFLFVDDAVKAFLLLLEKGTVGEIYNVGTSCEIPIIQLARELVKMVRWFKHDAKVGLWVLTVTFWLRWRTCQTRKWLIGWSLCLTGEKTSTGIEWEGSTLRLYKRT